MNQDIKQQIDEFNAKLTERLNDTNFIMNNDMSKPLDIYDDDNRDADDDGLQEDETNSMPEAEDLDVETLDKYIGTTFLLDPARNENNVATKVKVIRQNTDFNGRPIGKANNNPLLDTREYICEYPDGTLDTYHANTIAENLWSQCDSEGQEFMLYKEIIDHRKDDKAISTNDGVKV